MSNVYELLLRHPQLLDRNTTIIGSEAQLPAGWGAQAQASGVQLLSPDFLTANAWKQAGVTGDNISFAVPETQAITSRRVILLWPKAREAGQALVDMLGDAPSECFIVGANDAGGKSINNAVKKQVESVTKIDSARHCCLWQVKLKAPATAPNWLRTARSFKCGDLSFMTLPGVFGHGKMDKGTALLLEHIPAPAHGRIIDLGCGSGVIGLTMKQRSPALDVTLTDTDAMALRSAGLNSTRLGLTAEIYASDGLKQTNGRYDYVFSNPPFHQGKRTDYAFADDLFREAKTHLTRDGQLWIVANRHLAYEEWAEEAFQQVEVMVQADGFKLICASQPR
ncbi:MAG: class I SAM-dependent methyltransferase [Thalassolituus sp.]